MESGCVAESLKCHYRPELMGASWDQATFKSSPGREGQSWEPTTPIRFACCNHNTMAALLHQV